jgi:hypothetical protein
LIDKGVDGSLFSYERYRKTLSEGFIVRTFPLSELIVGCGDGASLISDFD